MTEHGPAIEGGAPGFLPHSQQMLPRFIDGIAVYKGIEANIIDYNGNVDFSEEYLSQTEFAIASFHQESLPASSCRENTKACVSAIQNPYIDMLGHPDDSRVPCDLQTLVSETKKLHKLVELNNNSLTPHRPNSRENLIALVRLCKRENVSVCVSSDAHFHTMVGHVEPIMKLLHELAFPEELITNRTRETFEQYLSIRAGRLQHAK
jgi:putative hydrolase